MLGRTRQIGLGLRLAAGLVAIYLLTYNGIYRVDDEHILGARTQSLALWGRLEAPQVSGNGRVQTLEPMGDQATQIEPLQSVLGGALYRLGLATGGAGRQAQLTLNLYVTAATAFVIYFTILCLGFGRASAWLTALAFGLGSMAWPYATTYFRDSLAMLMGSVAFLGWALLEGAANSSHKTAGAGLTLAGALGGMLAKSTMAVLPVAFLIGAVALLLIRRGKANGRRWRVWAALVGVVVLAVALALLPASGPLARYSLPYYAFMARHFWGSLLGGAWVYALGPFVSPARSLFLFSPPLLMLGLLPWARRRLAWSVALPMTIFVAGLALAQALFYRADWAGGFGWGLRFMLPALPSLFVLMAPVIETGLSNRKRITLGLFSGLLAVSALVQLSGAAVPWRAMFLEWQARGLAPYTAQAAWQVRFLVLPGQVSHLLQAANWDLAWMRVLRQGGVAGLAVPAVSLLTLALAALGRRGPRPGGRPARIWLAAALLAATLSPIVMTQTVLRGDPALAGDRPAYRAWLAWSHTNLVPSDSVVVDGYASPLWTYMTNAWNLPVRWYTLSFRAPQSGRVGPANQGDLDVLRVAGEQSERVWLVVSLDEPPDPTSAAADRPGLGRPVAVIDGHPAVVVWRWR
jgi:hypothetical protein